MAIVAGAGSHLAFVTVGGGTFPVEHGSVSQHRTRKTSSFSATVPLYYPGAQEAFAELGDNETKVRVLTRDVEQDLFTGETDTTEFDLIGGVIRISGRDKSAKLHENKTSEKWQNKKGHEIVKELAGRVGLSVQSDSSPVQAGKQLEQDYVRISDNTSFAYVIHKLAQLDGARWWVDAKGNLQYRIGNTPEGIYTINYRPPDPYVSCDATSLKIRRNIQAGKSVKVSVKSWHPKKKEVFEYESNVEGKGGPVEHKYIIPGLLNDHVKQYAKTKADEYARHEYTIHASVVGDPTINVAMGLQLSGTRFWDQVYEMDTVHHEFGMSGHRTSITARSPKKGRTAS
jgi:hypothetical protein